MTPHKQWLRTLPLEELTRDMYVDDPKERRGHETAHLMCRDPDELHEFARRMGITRWQYHTHRRHPHYDITRRQWYPSQRVFKRKYIAPYVKGPLGAPFKKPAQRIYRVDR